MAYFVIILTVILQLSLSQDNISVYEWRGKDRMGIYQEKNLLKAWPEDGPKEIWSIDNIGNGFVSPVFTEDHFFITGETDSIVALYCFNLEGNKLWQTTIGREWMKSYPGSRTAPTVVDSLVYVGTGMGNLICLRRDNGKILWSKDLLADFNGVLPLHGHSEAPLIDGDKIFWTPGGRINNEVALNRFTGSLIWSSRGYGERSAYNPPKLIRLPGRHIIVTFSAYHLLAFDAATGKLLWTHSQDNVPVLKRTPGLGDTHCNTVLYENGSVYYAAGDGNGGVKLNISKDGTKISEAWRNKGFDSYMGGIVKIGNYLYGCGTIQPDIRSINAVTGKLTDSLRIGSGALIAADNMLYYYTQRGDMVLLKYDQGKMEQVSSFKIKKGNMQHFSHPVINKGILYQRHGNVLMAFDIRNK
jgi:outer membrane protein assembly factor BamB